MISLFIKHLKAERHSISSNNIRFSAIVVNLAPSFLTLVYINSSSLSSWQMKHLLQSVSQRVVDDESSEADTFTSVNGTFTPECDNLLLGLNTSFSCESHIYKHKHENKGLDMNLLDIYNSHYHFEVNSVKNYAASVFIVA